MAPPFDRDATRALQLLRERMNRLFDEGAGRVEARFAGPFSPPTDVYTTDGRVVISVELPGVERSGLTVDSDEGVLTVRGQRRFRDGPTYHRLERAYGEFRCEVTLPVDADPSRKHLNLEDGVLTVEIPRSA
jgi:HSP20 family protein